VTSENASTWTGRDLVVGPKPAARVVPPAAHLRLGGARVGHPTKGVVRQSVNDSVRRSLRKNLHRKWDFFIDFGGQSMAAQASIVTTLLAAALLAIPTRVSAEDLLSGTLDGNRSRISGRYRGMLGFVETTGQSKDADDLIYTCWSKPGSRGSTPGKMGFAGNKARIPLIPLRHH
jgi:hypothetical protein